MIKNAMDFLIDKDFIVGGMAFDEGVGKLKIFSVSVEN